MTEIDRRMLIRGMLGCVAFVTAAGVFTATSSITKAVPLSETKARPLETDDAVAKDDAFEADDLLDVDDLLPESAQPAQYWRRRRRRWRRRRWICWRRRGRRVCRRRW
jgi:hypothetical protein